MNSTFFRAFVGELQKLGADLGIKDILEGSPRPSTQLEEDPFLRLKKKRKIVSGTTRGKPSVKAKRLVSGKAQFKF